MLSLYHHARRKALSTVQWLGFQGTFLEPPWPTLSTGTSFPRRFMTWFRDLPPLPETRSRSNSAPASTAVSEATTSKKTGKGKARGRGRSKGRGRGRGRKQPEVMPSIPDEGQAGPSGWHSESEVGGRLEDDDNIDQNNQNAQNTQNAQNDQGESSKAPKAYYPPDPSVDYPSQTRKMATALMVAVLTVLFGLLVGHLLAKREDNRRDGGLYQDQDQGSASVLRRAAYDEHSDSRLAWQRLQDRIIAGMMPSGSRLGWKPQPSSENGNGDLLGSAPAPEPWSSSEPGYSSQPHQQSFSSFSSYNENKTPEKDTLSKEDLVLRFDMMVSASIRHPGFGRTSPPSSNTARTGSCSCQCNMFNTNSTKRIKAEGRSHHSIENAERDTSVEQTQQQAVTGDGNIYLKPSSSLLPPKEQEDAIVPATLPADTAAALLTALLFDDPEPYLDLDSYLESYPSPYTRHPDADADEL
jgi:hypothetical protein